MTSREADSTEMFDGARRARTLRWLLKLRTAHDLPMPKRIDFSEMDSTSDVRWLTLGLDDDTDVTGWAAAVNADERDALPVTGDTRTWTYVVARTAWRFDEPRADWHLIEVTSHHHRVPCSLPGKAVAR